MVWAKRVLIGSAVAAASLMATPAVAGAAQPGCYNNCEPPAIASNSTGVAPSSASSSALPVTEPSSSSSSSGSSSSLPFTGADVEELAVIGAGAVIVGGLLNRRRRAQA